ncbi:MAG: ROK family protein [Actinomycetota bacterium]
MTTLSADPADRPGTSTASSSGLIGAVEAGGTKFRAAVFAGDGAVTGPAGQGGASPKPVAEIRIDTTTPDATLDTIADFFADHDIDALGIASFGPLIVDRRSPDYGTMAPTPKPGWTGARILDRLSEATGAPAEIQTDVEAAAVAEQRLGAGLGYESVAYVTVGTGVGVGVVRGDEVLRGRDHLELGHIPIQRHADDLDFAGVCPFHGDCLEGLVSGPALLERCGQPAEDLDRDDPVWDIVADYLAQLACVITWAFSPDRILFSGGVGANAHLEDRLRAATAQRLGGYSVSHADNGDLVATAGLGNDAGLVGAALLGASLLPRT